MAPMHSSATETSRAGDKGRHLRVAALRADFFQVLAREESCAMNCFCSVLNLRTGDSPTIM